MGEVEEALQLSPEYFQKNYDALQPKKHQDIVFYCMAGIRSLDALQTAQDLGYTKYVGPLGKSTAEPSNKRHSGANSFVRCREVVRI